MSAPPRALREAAFAYVLASALIVGLDLAGRTVPLVSANLLALVAACFLLVPIVLLRRAGLSDLDYGLAFERPAHGAAVGLLASLVVLAGFLPSYHAWNTRALGATALPSFDNYLRPAERLIGPPAAIEPGAVHVWTRHDVTVITWRDPGPDATLALHTTSGRLVAGPTAWAHGALTEHIDSERDGRSFTEVVRAPGSRAFAIEARRTSGPVEPDSWRLGAAAAPARPEDLTPGGALRVRQSPWWLLTLLASQLLLVALPEEFFYRGYLQQRLREGLSGGRATGAEAPRGRWTPGPLRVSLPNLLTSVLFAIGHVIVGLDPARLAVFFPSLLFGWLRERTDGIVAPIVCHAACNMMVQLAAVHYW